MDINNKYHKMSALIKAYNFSPEHLNTLDEEKINEMYDAYVSLNKINSPKLLIVGYARHGKDTAAEFFRDNFGLTFKSSSLAAAEIFIFDVLKDKYGYKTFDECFEDRVNHRAEWADLINEYNREDGSKLARCIMESSNCYIGMRDPYEINACMEAGLFDLVIWIDACERLPKEDMSSIKITKDIADVIIENNQTEEIFKAKLLKFGRTIFK